LDLEADTTFSEKYVTIFSPEDGKSMFIRNVGISEQIHTASPTGRPTSIYRITSGHDINTDIAKTYNLNKFDVATDC
jgi:hypothetical protein